MDQLEPKQTQEELKRLLQAKDASGLDSLVESLSVGEAAHAIEQMTEESRAEVLRVLGAEDAADLVERLPDSQAADLLTAVGPKAAAAILHELPSNEQADLIGELDADEAEQIIDQMSAQDAADARLLTAYPEDVAGGLMIREYLSFPAGATVQDVKEELAERGEEYESYDIQYAYALDRAGGLVGVVPMRRLLFARRAQHLHELMIAPVLSVGDHSSLEELRAFFDHHHFYGVPVIDDQGSMVGVVRRSAVEEATSERAETDLQRSQGLMREELRSMPLLRRTSRRLAWLSLNVVLNCLAASVIAYYQDTLTAVIALAVFLPMISDMSGCSGSQAVAVSLRELTLGLSRKGFLLHVLGKEAAIGVLNGLALGLLLGGVAWLWQGSAWLGLVVGGTMAINTLIAVSLGGGLPIALRAMKVDPALASGPILTTVTDLCGFFLALSLATALLSRLVG